VVKLLEACYEYKTRYFFKEAFQRLAERSLSTLTLKNERIRISTYIGLVMVTEKSKKAYQTLRLVMHLYCQGFPYFYLFFLIYFAFFPFIFV